MAVDDNLTTSQASIALRTANNKSDQRAEYRSSKIGQPWSDCQGVGVEPGKQARAARGGQLSAEFVCEHDRYTRASCGRAAIDIGGFPLDHDEDVARLVVETLGRAVVPRALDRLMDHLLVVVELRFGVELSKEYDNARLRGRLAGDLNEELGSRSLHRAVNRVRRQ
ncbi:hypothetical protein V8E53_012633 [Lactarius tabidus]